MIAEKDVRSRSSLGDFFELFDPDYQFRSFVLSQTVPVLSFRFFSIADEASIQEVAAEEIDRASEHINAWNPAWAITTKATDFYFVSPGKLKFLRQSFQKWLQQLVELSS